MDDRLTRTECVRHFQAITYVRDFFYEEGLVTGSLKVMQKA
jgi:hypothetical protein